MPLPSENLSISALALTPSSLSFIHSPSFYSLFFSKTFSMFLNFILNTIYVPFLVYLHIDTAWNLGSLRILG